MHRVADADFVRRQNRALVLAALRRDGPMSRTQLAAVTGLSNASITAISTELIGQAILTLGEMPAPPPVGVLAPGLRGRPAVPVAFNRLACRAVIVELDVNRARFTLIDYAGALVDRTETPLTPDFFVTLKPGAFLVDRVSHLLQRNPETVGMLRHIAVSAQGILDRDAVGLKWSPIPHIGGESLVAPLENAFGIHASLQKRGRLLAEGARLLIREFGNEPIAALFIGSTVAMGLSVVDPSAGPEAGTTEFGHMNHLPDGARCRCGMRGCVEAYAADYGVLRTAYGVPDHVVPAARVPPAAYRELIELARGGKRNAVHAFNVAGQAIGYGLSRLLTLVSPAQIVVTGPGADAFELMRPRIEAALAESLVCRVNGLPSITVLHDEHEPIFQGMLARALAALDQTFFATLEFETRISSVRH